MCEVNQFKFFVEVVDRIVVFGVFVDMVECFWCVVLQNIIRLDDLGVWWDIFLKGVDLQIDVEDVDFVVQVMIMLLFLFYIDVIWGEFIVVVKQVIGCKGKGLFMLLCKVLMGQVYGLDMLDVMLFLQVVCVCS